MNAKDVAGYSCAHQATASSANHEALAIFRLIAYKYGASVNVKNRFDTSPLNCTLITPREELVEALLTHGAQVTPLPLLFTVYCLVVVNLFAHVLTSILIINL